MLQGPHYVVSKFQVFVCSDCSGIHRQFGHRVKAVSLSSFTMEEVNALQNSGGNAAFTRTYCAGLPRDFVKPKSTSHDHIRNWIEDVYVLKKFYKDIEIVEGSRPPMLDIAAENVAIVPLSEILGADTPILHISLEKFKDEIPEKGTDMDQCADKRPVENLLGDWDPFEAQVPLSDAPCTEADTFAECQNETEPALEVTSTHTAEDGKDTTFEEEWESFMSDSIAPSSEKGQKDLENHYTDIHEQEQSLLSSTTISAGRNRQEDSKQVIELKKEIPLEAFYPEFEQIRATGILPTGQPVPWIQPGPLEQIPPPSCAPHEENNQVHTNLSKKNPVHVPPATKSAHTAVNPTDKAVATLFGREKNLTAYDLTAPLAAKPATSGNPFA